MIPAEIPQEVTLLACEWAERAFRHFGCRGVIRADYRWDEDGDRLVMLEINTVPGMTATSLVPEQARFVGLSGEELVNHGWWRRRDATTDPLLETEPRAAPREAPESGVLRRAPLAAPAAPLLRGAAAIGLFAAMIVGYVERTRLFDGFVTASAGCRAASRDDRGQGPPAPKPVIIAASELTLGEPMLTISLPALHERLSTIGWISRCRGAPHALDNPR